MDQEQRRFSRIGLEMTAELTINEHCTTFERIDNLSIGGCRLETSESFELNAACRFWLPLGPPDSGLGIEAFGRIAGCDGGTVRIHFTRISQESLAHLHNIVRYNAPDSDRIEAEIQRHPGLV